MNDCVTMYVIRALASSIVCFRVWIVFFPAFVVSCPVTLLQRDSSVPLLLYCSLLPFYYLLEPIRLVQQLVGSTTRITTTTTSTTTMILINTDSILIVIGTSLLAMVMMRMMRMTTITMMMMARHYCTIRGVILTRREYCTSWVI